MIAPHNNTIPMRQNEKVMPTRVVSLARPRWLAKNNLNYDNIWAKQESLNIRYIDMYKT